MLNRGSRTCTIQLSSTKIVNAIPALFDQLHDLFDPGPPAIDTFERATRLEAAASNSENYRVEKRSIFLIEGTIYEDSQVRRWARH